MEIFFCDRCGRRVTEAEIERKEAGVVDTEVYCKVCLRDDAELRERVQASDKAAARPSARKPSSAVISAVRRESGTAAATRSERASTGHRQRITTARDMPLPVAAPAKKDTTVWLAAGIFLALGLIGLAVMLLTRGPAHHPPPPKPRDIEQPPAPQRPATIAAPPVAPPPWRP